MVARAWRSASPVSLSATAFSGGRRSVPSHCPALHAPGQRCHHPQSQRKRVLLAAQNQSVVEADQPAAFVFEPLD
jgi:hypothetical protein